MKIFKKIFAVFSVITVFLSGTCGFLQSKTANEYFAFNGEEFKAEIPFVKADADTALDVSLQGGRGEYEAQLKLFNIFPVCQVHVSSVDAQDVAVSGEAFGLRLMTDGVMVLDTSSILTKNGNESPAKKAGIKKGDILKTANGVSLIGNDSISQVIKHSNGKTVEITGEREGKSISFKLDPVLCSTDNLYKGGIWVRDSTAGIGTMTFFNEETGRFGGLGHGVNDVDTGVIMPLSSGDIMDVTVSGCIKASSGKAGELKGYFASDIPRGKLTVNDETGVYGEYYHSLIPLNKQSYPVALKQEIRKGKAEILTTVDENGPCFYGIEITDVSYDEEKRTQNLTLKVTDEKLIEKTGGIVQGMSGSPIIQNGKLVGAVTHVFLNNPLKGYGIFAENML